MGFKGNIAKEEYNIIVSREEELKERIQNVLLVEDYGEWNELLKIMKLRHSIKLKLTYEKRGKEGCILPKSFRL